MNDKRYLLFGYDTYCQGGGVHDIVANFSMEEYDQLKKYEEDYDWWQILDTETLKTYTAIKRTIPKITYNIEELVGKTLTSIERDEEGEPVFQTIDGEKFIAYNDSYEYDYISLDEVMGDLDNLIGTPIKAVEESLTVEEYFNTKDEYLYYKFVTDKGHVKLRWIGESEDKLSDSIEIKLIKAK